MGNFMQIMNRTKKQAKTLQKSTFISTPSNLQIMLSGNNRGTCCLHGTSRRRCRR